MFQSIPLWIHSNWIRVTWNTTVHPFRNKYKWSWPYVSWALANILAGVTSFKGYKKHTCIHTEGYISFSEKHLALSTGTTRIFAPFKYNVQTEKSHLTRSWRWRKEAQKAKYIKYTFSKQSIRKLQLKWWADISRLLQSICNSIS